LTRTIQTQKIQRFESYDGSPASQGILQHDMWSVKDSNRHDWASLRAKIKQNGLRNSLLVAPMPTASTAQILGNTECFEPITSNVYSRRVLSGEFPLVSRYLVEDLMKLDLWNNETLQSILASNGSVQQMSISDKLKEKHRTVWEIKQKSIIEMAADRAPYIDQSQSMNLFLTKPTNTKISSMHFGVSQNTEC
jgi:ribonucleotide reductase alpha subunit